VLFRSNHPNEGIATRWHAKGGTLVSLDGAATVMTWIEFDQERSQPLRNKLWNAPNSVTGH